MGKDGGLFQLIELLKGDPFFFLLFSFFKIHAGTGFITG